jgi:cytochrome P450
MNFEAPDHVPSNLYHDLELKAFAAQFDDPFVGIQALQHHGELIYLRDIGRGTAGWVPTRYDVIQEIFMDAKRFSNAENIGVGPLMGVDWRLNPLEYDPPEHMAYRQVLQPFFQPTKIKGYDHLIRSIARELIARFNGKRQIDFVEDFASLFPSYIFLDLLGLPREELPQFFEWEQAFTRSPDMAARAGGARSILRYLEDYVARRRGDPRDDLVTGIINGQVKGRPLNHGEVMGMVMVLYFGGLDTVLSSLGWYFRALALDQDLQARLRANPADIPGATDDLLRAFGVTGTRRTVVADMTFRNVALKKGDFVLMPTFLACRDETQYADPHRVDPDRKARHITLATGVHNCLGAHLARLEIQIVLEEWLAHIPAFRIGAGKPQRWDAAGVWAMTELWLEW